MLRLTKYELCATEHVLGPNILHLRHELLITSNFAKILYTACVLKGSRQLNDLWFGCNSLFRLSNIWATIFTHFWRVLRMLQWIFIIVTAQESCGLFISFHRKCNFSINIIDRKVIKLWVKWVNRNSIVIFKMLNNSMTHLHCCVVEKNKIVMQETEQSLFTLDLVWVNCTSQYFRKINNNCHNVLFAYNPINRMTGSAERKLWYRLKVRSIRFYRTRELLSLCGNLDLHT